MKNKVIIPQKGETMIEAIKRQTEEEKVAASAALLTNSKKTASTQDAVTPGKTSFAKTEV